MTVEWGHFALILALVLSLCQLGLPLWGLVRGDAGLMQTARGTAIGAFGFTVLAFAALTYAYVQSDFSVINVAMNSHSTKPLAYKISGVWSNHEGSMLLWVLILTLFGALVALSRQAIPLPMLAAVLMVQGAVASAFFSFILITSNPFLRNLEAPVEGRGLNPILQDPGLAIHPPLLYIGYVGFSIAFSFAIGALIHGRIDAVWARFVRPWTLLAWSFLTLGIAMGSYWAYYELGWGGFWFWDPVENASLMPWLAGSALLHSTVVMEKRDALKVWTILLSILTFSLSLIGTFLVRSGVLTSVHAFASDPSRGKFILGLLVIFIGGGLTLFAWRAHALRQGGLFAPISREAALVLNNLVMATLAATVLIGTLYPLVLEAINGSKISVGAPFFEATMLPLFMPLALLQPIGTSLSWKRADIWAAMQRLSWVFGFSVLVMGVALYATRGGSMLPPVGAGLGLWLVLASLADVVMRGWRNKAGWGVNIARLIGMPRSAWGTALAHAGLGISMIGIAATGWGTEYIAMVGKGDEMPAGPYRLVLEEVITRNGPDYRETVGRFTVFNDQTILGMVEPGKRVFIGQTMPKTEAGLMTIGLGQVYASLGDFQPDGTVALRLYWKPLVMLIWGGALVMALGGFLSMSDRRARIAAPHKSRESKEATA
jgi:cytochrome c-type biogenesis protein CcmF